MQSVIEARQTELAKLCRRSRVRRLDLFGSATTDRFDPETSDLDFLVEFEPMPPSAYADAWFVLHDGLEALFGRKVDLVSARGVVNPYLAASIASSRRTLFAA